MESGDGLLLRVRPRGSVLSAHALRVIAGVSARFGNGRVDLTRRANLQVRGLRRETLGDAQAALAGAGLLDRDERLESARNILLSPLAGCDPLALFDGGAIAAAIERGLAADLRFGDLPAKFSFLVDEGGRLPLGDLSADIRIEAEGRQARLALGGDGSDAVRAVVVEPKAAADAALALALAFLDHAVRTGAGRMRGVVDRIGAPALAETAGLAVAALAPRPSRRPRAARGDLFGRQRGFFGVGAPFGSVSAADLERLAALSPAGARATPWRALLLPDLAPEAEPAVEALGLVTHAADPRLRVAACPGGPACLSGEVATRPLAEALAGLASLAGDGVALHVSGCSKGCAHSAAAPFTLVGREERFDLVVDGTARDAATLSGLDGPQVERAIRSALASRRQLAS